MKLFDNLRNKISLVSKNYEKLQDVDNGEKEIEKSPEIYVHVEVDEKTHEKTTFKYADDGSCQIYTEPDDFVNNFYNLSEIIGSGKYSISERLEACEKSLVMLPEMCRYWIEETNDSPPPIINCRDYGVELNMRIGDWENALRVINLCIDVKAYDQEEGKIMLEYFYAYRSVAEIACSYIAEHPGCLQKDMYKVLVYEEDDKEVLKHFLRCSLQIRKEKYSSTNKLFINNDIIV